MDEDKENKKQDPIKGSSPRFLTFCSQTIAFETGGDKSGAYHDDPKDSGGETKWGISKKSHPNENIKALTYNGALRIYETQYWNVLYDYIGSDKLSFKVWDMGVVSGKRKAVKKLQRAIRATGTTLKVDGMFGPITLTAVNISDQEKLYEIYIKKYTKFYNWLVYFKPKNKRFLKGWLRRLNWVWSSETEPGRGSNGQW